jgi:hypothetical protein
MFARSGAYLKELSPENKDCDLLPVPTDIPDRAQVEHGFAKVRERIRTQSQRPLAIDVQDRSAWTFELELRPSREDFFV